MAAQGAGQAAGMASDTGKAERAKRSVFALIDRPSAIDALAPEDTEAKPLLASPIRGEISLRNVSFSYPSRPDHLVFKNLTLEIPAGKVIALVGPSGGGKSTVIALLQRFYDVQTGSVSVDGVNIKEVHPKSLRSAQALVPQMPALWSDSVEYNIAYGALPGLVPPPDAGVAVDAGVDAAIPATFVHSEAVEEAAIQANAHNFISSFPHGYATHVGAGGGALSGGQRSRVAIARAVRRAPRILLLDEATAALDSESERIVQAALDKLIEAKANSSSLTAVIVAHRLSTIRRADIIAVIADGSVVEQGSHSELMKKTNGLYRSLALAQDPDALSQL
jgi:ATP-binding cassette, subfamily B (MDR/TAP), member 1